MHIVYKEMTVQDLFGSGFVTGQNISNMNITGNIWGEDNMTEDYVTDGNVTDVVVDGGPLGPSPCEDESGLLNSVILVLVILILMQCCLRYC